MSTDGASGQSSSDSVGSGNNQVTLESLQTQIEKVNNHTRIYKAITY